MQSITQQVTGHYPPEQLAALGLRIFPAHNVHNGRCSCGNPRCENPAKHPRFKGWQSAATTDLAQIGQWRRQYPYANWANAVEGLVLDNDPRNGGAESLIRLEHDHGALPLTWRSNTGGGGEHYYFSLPPGVTVRSGPLEGYPGLDIKTVNSLVIAPGSVHASGRRYEWAADAHPDDIPRAEAPAWLVRLAARPRKVETAAASDAEPIIANRNVTLTSLAGKLRQDGLSQGAIEAALLVTNAERCQPPLPEQEVCAIAKSVARYPAGTLPPLPPDLVEAEGRAQYNGTLQSATVRATVHPRARKLVPVGNRIAAELLRRKQNGVPPDTEDGLYYIPKYSIGGYDPNTKTWEIKEATVRNHTAELREYAPHIPGFRAAKRPINFPKREIVDAETGEFEMVDHYEDTWCYAFDGDPADIVAALPYLPYPEDGRGKRCGRCGAEKKTRTVEYCPQCETVEVVQKPEGQGVKFTPTPPGTDIAPDQGGEQVLTPSVNTPADIPKGVHTYPHPTQPTLEDWKQLYRRARDNTPPLQPARTVFLPEPPPGAAQCHVGLFGNVCPHPDQCAEAGRCKP